MFGLNEALISFIRRQVGLRTDSASSSGSVHAKLGYLENEFETLINTVQKPRSTRKLTFTTRSESYVTALDITGKGTLRCLKYRVRSTHQKVYIQVMIDGTTILDFSDGDSMDKWQYLKPDLDYDSLDPYAIAIAFKQSLQIKVKIDDYNYGSVDMHCVYEAE